MNGITNNKALILLLLSVFAINCQAKKPKRASGEQTSKATSPVSSEEEGRSEEGNDDEKVIESEVNGTISDALSVSDYSSLIGLNYGDKLEKVEEVYPAPFKVIDEPDSIFVYRYYGNYPEADYMIGIRRETSDVAIVSVHRRGVAELELAGIKDEQRLKVFKMKREDLENTFGPETDSAHKTVASYLGYDVTLKDGRDYSLTFKCFDHDDRVCSEVSVLWYGK